MLPACDHLQLKSIWITDRWQKYRTHHMHFDPFRSLQKRWITLRSGCRTHIFTSLVGWSNNPPRNVRWNFKSFPNAVGIPTSVHPSSPTCQGSCRGRSVLKTLHGLQQRIELSILETFGTVLDEKMPHITDVDIKKCPGAKFILVSFDWHPQVAKKKYDDFDILLTCDYLEWSATTQATQKTGDAKRLVKCWLVTRDSHGLS